MILENNINLLLIEDEDYDVRRIKKTLEPFKEQLIIKKVVADGHSAIEALQKNKYGFDVVIMDYQIMGGISGEALIRKIKEIDQTIQIIVITKMTVNITDFDFANRLLEAGAMWYCTKYPGDIDDYIYQPTDFILSIFNAFEKKCLEKEKRHSNKKLSQNIQSILNSKTIIGNSKPIQQLREQINKLSGYEATVLINGASGTGKELVAAHLHYTSKRKFENFVVINCGSLPHDLIESELFGFEKGAFTGAANQKAGLFEIADRGTIFLDEVAELPLSAQVKLLRALQDGEIDKIGRTEKIKVDVRIIAATNKNLKDYIQENKFREDLFYRLNVVTIRVPSLKERRNDISLFIDYFLKRFCSDMSIPVPDIDEDALSFLSAFDWPGNVRQLQNVLQRILFITEKKITLSDVQNALGLQSAPAAQNATHISSICDVNNILTWREIEKTYKRDYFKFVRENTSSDAEAARKLGLAPPNYYRMCKELGLK